MTHQPSHTRFGQKMAECASNAAWRSGCEGIDRGWTVNPLKRYRHGVLRLDPEAVCRAELPQDSRATAPKTVKEPYRSHSSAKPMTWYLWGETARPGGPWETSAAPSPRVRSERGPCRAYVRRCPSARRYDRFTTLL